MRTRLESGFLTTTHQALLRETEDGINAHYAQMRTTVEIDASYNWLLNSFAINADNFPLFLHEQNDIDLSVWDLVNFMQ